MSREHTRWKFAAAVAGTVALGVAVNTATDRSSEDLTSALQKNDLVQCERGNRVRAFLRADALSNAASPTARRLRADALFPILDCDATTRAGVNVPLSPREQDVYIRLTIPPVP